MQFKLVPILDRMKALYQMPRSRARFDAYLHMLQGAQKSDMILPIAGYNPMGGELVLTKLRELKKLQAEALIDQELQMINQSLNANEERVIEVVLNLVDNIGGAWSNYHTTDYASKFDFAAIIKRNFCTPYYWTSEDFDEAMIRKRTREYVYRSITWLEKGKPKSLKDFLDMEVQVQVHSTPAKPIFKTERLEQIADFYQKNLDAEEYDLIFNFFYGDEASAYLQYKCYGVAENLGFEYARYLAQTKKISS